MRTFFASKIAFLAILMIFTAGCICNISQGAAITPADHFFLEAVPAVAHGPSMPPDPWDGNLALKHGPSMPPDPWDGNLALKHGPSMPPDPWDGNLTRA
jgi:hypothetical protein